MNKIKVGLIGTGFSATSHIEALRRLPNIEIVAVAGSTKGKAERMAERYAIPSSFDDAFKLISDPEVEAVHNCTPNDLHFSINEAVLLAGKHLLSEKPLAMNSEESARLVELAEKSSVVSGVCFNYRHYPLVAQAKAMIESGEIGKANLIYGGYLQDWLLYETDYNWRLESERNGASRAIADIGSHWCDTAQYILGRRIVEVFADLKTVHPVRLKYEERGSTFDHSQESSQDSIQTEVPIATEDYGSVLVHFEDGIQGVFTISQVSAGRKNKLHLEVAATQAALAWDQEEPNRLWIGKRNEPNRELWKDPSLLSASAVTLAHYPGGHQEGWPDGLKNLFIDFYEQVQQIKSVQQEKRKSTASFATMEEGHRMMKIVEAVLESNRTKRWVRIDEWSDKR